MAHCPDMTPTGPSAQPSGHDSVTPGSVAQTWSGRLQLCPGPGTAPVGDHPPPAVAEVALSLGAKPISPPSGHSGPPTSRCARRARKRSSVSSCSFCQRLSSSSRRLLSAIRRELSEDFILCGDSTSCYESGTAPPPPPRAIREELGPAQALTCSMARKHF